MSRLSVFDSSCSAFVSSALLALACALALGCSSETGEGGHDEGEGLTTGTAKLPLVTTVNGNVYRLSNAGILVCGPRCTFLSSSDDPNETTLSTVLQTGSYHASLQSWGLQRRDEAGAFQPVQAELVSDPTAFFQVFNGTTSTISYQFRTDGVIVLVGEGTLNVNVGVTETPSTCTPFGNDCAEGSWCPPADLTGSPLACVSAGPAALGEACGSATSCVAGASCFDIGEGPVCVALCADTELGAPCAAGGTCQAAGTTYGLCR